MHDDETRVISVLGSGSAGRERLEALRRSELLDAPPDESFERLTRLACMLLRVPVALISLVDEDRQFFISQQGLPEPWAKARQTPLSHSFCQHVVATGDPLIVSDARENPLVCGNFAIRDLNVIAYLGLPLVDPDGHVLGSLCAISDQARDWQAEEIAALNTLAVSVMTEIALRKELRERVRIESALRESEARNRLLAREINHRLKNGIATVQSLVRQTLRSSTSLEYAQAALEGRLSALARAHDLLLEGGPGETTLRPLVENALSPFGQGEGRIVLEGDAVELGRDAALMFALVFHELATNAVKHGALRSREGAVQVAWEILRGSDEQRLRLSWIETGDPPATRPQRVGFGSVLIRRAAQSLDGEATIEYTPEGLRCILSMPLPKAG